ncbi:type IV pilus biogenesis/stability protein PilW [Pseudomonas sp. NPDC098747]|uniref:tetratricopeptide repeat protein n=1 Tax=Pseudomonas sp. NPDC098747 TaxID=3364487 RepID=UPI00383A5A51
MFKLKFLVMQICAHFLLITACHAENLNLIGVDGATLKFSEWDQNLAVWKQITFSKNNLEFSLYESGPHYLVGGGTTSSSRDPDGKYTLIQRTVFGELGDGQQIVRTEKSYCDLVSLTTGCVLLTRPAAACSGSWKEGKWSTDEGEIIKPLVETISPGALVQSVAAVSDAKSRAMAIKDQIFMGASSYMSCYPPKKNVRALNDLGFFLAQAGDDSSALELYRGIELIGKRTVLMLNIADSLWNMEKKAEAIKYYKLYSDEMNSEEKGDKIPIRVYERSKPTVPQ